MHTPSAVPSTVDVRIPVPLSAAAGMPGRPSAGAGRPRDPQVDRRIAEAALGLFGDAGWAGFAMESVARRAGVGKASVYLRWSSKEALLTDAVTMRLSRVTD